MRCKAVVQLLLLLAALPCPAAAAQNLLYHDLEIVFDPDAQSLAARDTLTVPEEILAARGRLLTFFLHGGLSPASLTPEVSLSVRSSGRAADSPDIIEVAVPAGVNTFTIGYGGTIYHPLEAVGEEYARGQRATAGQIGSGGIYLPPRALWYPAIDSGRITFTLSLKLPAGWDAVSQGKRTLHLRTDEETLATWSGDRPQGGVFVVAGRYFEFTKRFPNVEAMVFLREADRKLADRYLEATGEYIAMYSDLIGPYPYDKFALVENYWETGYGMPSFTLMGPKVIRFPFILHSSYPHEILHNWWGNGVYIDYASGNWGEGLTAYLSDHLVKEQRGQGSEHRQNVLQKYRDYVLKDRDYPISQFRSRHGSVSESVGYGKTLMLFHMLRRKLGDDLFRRSLQDFYKSQSFRTASFEDLRSSFEKSTGRELGPFFKQWVTLPGAPQLELDNTALRLRDGKHLLSGALLQTQAGGGAFAIDVPLAVTLEGEDEAVRVDVPMDGRRTEFTLEFSSPPLRLDVDPEFDLFRRLHAGEIPPALTSAFGSDQAVILIPSAAAAETVDMYRDLAGYLTRTGPGEVTVRRDDEFDRLPPDRSVWLLGWENRFLPDIIAAASGYGADLSGDRIRLGMGEVPKAGHAFVLTARHSSRPDLTLLWIGADTPSAMAGLGRKLPHYHKYSYLAFEGSEPTNVVKGRWPVTSSPLTLQLTAGGDAGTEPVKMGILPKRQALAERSPLFSGDRMMETVRFLAADDMQGRGLGSAALDRAADFIAAGFAQAGLRPGGDDGKSYIQEWTHRDDDFPEGVRLRNVVGVIPGAAEGESWGSVVIGAHYDGLGLGEGLAGIDVRAGNEGLLHPGADDNASGVAVLLELARVLGRGAWKPGRTVIFAAFTGEEAGKLGSRYFVSDRKVFSPEDCLAMLNLDTVGRLSNRKLLVLGGESAREWVHIFRGAGYLAGVDVELAAEALDASDQTSFQEVGVPAVQLCGGIHLDYHRPSDRIDRIDAEGLVKVASLTREVLQYLAGRQEPLTASDASGAPPSPAAKSGRRSSLGTVPDFAHAGKGVLLDDVVPGSPAEKAGLEKGDIVTAVGEITVSSMRDLSTALKTYPPGSRVHVTFERDGKKRGVEVLLEKR